MAAESGDTILDSAVPPADSARVATNGSATVADEHTSARPTTQPPIPQDTQDASASIGEARASGLSETAEFALQSGGGAADALNRLAVARASAKRKWNHPEIMPSTNPNIPSAANDGISRDARPKHLVPSDGRITSAIPHKLQGKADSANGNFALIKIDLANTTRSERDAAAKRTSEGTAAAAQAAFRDGYRPLKRAKAQYRSQVNRWEPTSSTQNSAPPGPPAPSGPPPGLVAIGFPGRLPSPVETKAEQARLLTLLRSIHPNSIVDQLCKGLAFFGGIPGAPPMSPEGIPFSGSHNGSGALFVAWLSEIFPPVYPAFPQHMPQSSAPTTPTAPTAPSTSQPNPQPQPYQNQPAAHRRDSLSAASSTAPAASVPPGPAQKLPIGPTISQVTLPKRRRGRPKGSKSSKPRKDKGIKKGPRLSAIHADHSTLSEKGFGREDAVSEDVDEPPDFEEQVDFEEPRQGVSPATMPNQTPNSNQRDPGPGSKNRPRHSQASDVVMGESVEGEQAEASPAQSPQSPVAPEPARHGSSNVAQLPITLTSARKTPAPDAMSEAAP